jgi:hypothetical protein
MEMTGSGICSVQSAAVVHLDDVEKSDTPCALSAATLTRYSVEGERSQIVTDGDIAAGIVVHDHPEELPPCNVVSVPCEAPEATNT